MWLWDKVVAFIEETESRVSVEHHKIAGEDFKMWRWHANTSEVCYIIYWSCLLCKQTCIYQSSTIFAISPEKSFLLCY